MKKSKKAKNNSKKNLKKKKISLKESIIDFAKSNALLLILFFMSLFLFLFQHASILSWDFSSYVLNSKYLF